MLTTLPIVNLFNGVSLCFRFAIAMISLLLANSFLLLRESVVMFEVLACMKTDRDGFMFRVAKVPVSLTPR